MSDLLRFASFSRIEGVRHGFAGADAFGAFDGRREADLLRLVEAVAPSARLVRTRQTHSAQVRWVEAGGPSPSERELAAGIDGLATADRSLALTALGADCPMLFLADRARRAVAVVHCGWRGVAGGIVDAALALLEERAGCAPSALLAAVAPGARGCCYEVGSEVVEALERAAISVATIARPYLRPDGSLSRAVDLSTGIAARLVALGVDPRSIELAEACTICGGASFHSHRRSGEVAGRMAGAIALAAERR
ncbi:MAG: polyphenol oxidase family protein [Planctomycetes bacterium]|nr:polyphenol oxidase family protein [Planctomycetota bacterium]